MILRELPLTNFASPAEPVANVRRGFSFVLAPAAADLVLELEGAVHCWVCFLLFLIWRVFAFVFWFSSRRLLLHASRFCLDSDGPDEAQQFACDCRHGLPLILACHGQLHVTLVQAVLRFPCNLGDLHRNPLLSLAQLGPRAGQMSIGPGRFDNDSSEVRVAGLGNAASSNALATGVFARKHS